MSLTQPKRIPCLDGLRCLAVLMVVIYHHYPRGVPGWDWAYRSGWAGVDLFFVLSGYLITTLLLREVRETGRIHVVHFWLRRLFRLWPAWLVSLGLSSAVVWKLGAHDAALRSAWKSQIIEYLCCLGNYAVIWNGSLHPTFGHYWSLAVEEHYYLIWPLLVVACGRNLRALRRITVLGLIVPILVRLAYVVKDPAAIGTWTHYATHCRFDSLIWGCLLAQLAPKLPSLSRARGSLVSLMSLAVFVGAIWLDAFPALFEVLGYTLIAFSSALMVWSVRDSRPALLYSLLEAPLVTWVGRISYSVYLVHPVALTIGFAMNKHLAEHGIAVGLTPQIFADVTLSIGAGAALHYLVEKRFHSWRDRFRAPCRKEADRSLAKAAA